MIVYEVEYRILAYIAKQKQLQIIYVMDEDNVIFTVSQGGVVFKCAIKYEDTMEFKIKYFEGALQAINVFISTDLLLEVRNLLDENKFRESIIQVNPNPPNVMTERDGIPKPLVTDEIISETKPADYNVNELISGN